MAFQLSPGVVVTEEDRTTFVPSVATTAGAFTGAFQWGPVEEVTTVDSESSLVSTFGRPNDTTAGYFFTAANFLSYGNNLKVVRVVDKSTSRNAVSTPTGVLTAITLPTDIGGPTNVTTATFLTASNINVTIGSPITGGTQATANTSLKTTGNVAKLLIKTAGQGYNTAPILSFETTAGGAGASAIATLGSGAISNIYVLNGGNNYTSSSNIVIQNQNLTNASANLNVRYKLIQVGVASGGTNYGPQANIQFSGNLAVGGAEATAQLVLTGNVITGVTIAYMGAGYIGAPNVIINRNDGNTGSNASFVANIGHGYVDSVTIVNDGAGGYSYQPAITINRNNSLGGDNAAFQTRINCGIASVTLLDSGTGYTRNPNVTVTGFVPDDGFITTNAEILAVIEYLIDRVNLINPGTGYGSAPIVTVSTVAGFSTPANATITSNPTLITNRDFYQATYENGFATVGEFAAKYPGELGNSIRVSMADSNTFSTWQYAANFDSAPGTSAYVSGKSGSLDEMHVIVVDSNGTWSGTSGYVLEKFSFLSKASDAKNSDGSTNYYRDVINNQSNYVWWMDHPSQGTNWGTSGSNKTFAVLSSAVTNTLSGGVSSDSVSSGNVSIGYNLFSNDELYDVSLIPMGPTTDVSVVNSVIGIASTRRDAVVFVSPPYTSVVNSTTPADNIVSYRNTLTDSSYAVLDSGWKYQYDRYNDKYRYVPLNGDIAGLAARTDYIADPWFSPAGYNRGVIKNVVKLAYSPSKTDRDTLYKKGVNPVVTFPGQGTLLFGDKTLQSRPSAFDRINVRRLFIVLEKAISTASKFQLFEFNDPFTRGQFRNLVEPFLRDVQGRRGITDFKVVCDETNNPASVIDGNQFVADIYIKPARSINFIQLNFIATRTGVSFEEVGA